MQRMRSILNDILMTAISSKVLDHEHNYQAFIVGLLINLFETI